MAEHNDDRTEAPSAKRLQKAREDGNVPVSRELSLVAGLGASLAALAAQLGAAPQAPQHWLAAMLHQTRLDPGTVFVQAGADLLRAVLPAAGAGIAAVAAATFLQSTFLIRGAALQPDFSRISPMRGIKRIFSTDTLAQAARSCAKLLLLIGALRWAVPRLRPDILASPLWVPAALRDHLVGSAVTLVTLMAGAQAGIAAVDVLWVRFQHARKLRMSRQEQRDESKEAEGNPQVKNRVRQIARARARRRMMAAVPKATVIVTNPTHYAIALAYQQGARGAPMVVAKGADDIAARIRDLAQEHRIPMVANAPLARALYRVELDAEIPAEHFKAVAEIVAYVWRLRARRGRL